MHAQNITDSPIRPGRIGVIGDIHRTIGPLETTLALFRRKEVDAILSVGDIVSDQGEGDTAACITTLTTVGASIVAGNHERWLSELPSFAYGQGVRSTIDEATRRLLSSLPSISEIDTIVGPILLCHGTGSDDMAGIHTPGSTVDVLRGRAFRQALGRSPWTIMVCGHTHRRFVIGFNDESTKGESDQHDDNRTPHALLATAPVASTPRRIWSRGLFRRRAAALPRARDESLSDVSPTPTPSTGVATWPNRVIVNAGALIGDEPCSVILDCRAGTASYYHADGPEAGRLLEHVFFVDAPPYARDAL